MNEEYREPVPAPEALEPEPARRGIPIPLSKPRATIVLLVIIGVIFVLQYITDAIALRPGLEAYGVQINALIATGGAYRLLTAMFLHASPAHFIFNGWALLSLGQEVEALYGTRRFLVVYFLAGLLGNVASYLVPTFLIPPASQLAGAPQWLITPSLGASGAIFGIVGADVAFYLANRRSMGNPGQRQLLNLVILIGINLVIGFTPGSNINNYAHLGGLIGGLALGAGLSPRYAAGWDPIAGQPRLVNHRTLSREAFVVAGVCLVLLLGWYLGTQRWEPYLAFLM